MTLEQQIITLLAMIGNGFFIGIMFDGYRVVKGKISPPKIIIMVIDIGFGIFSGLLAFYLLYWINHGQLRLIILLFFLLGLLIYYFLLSKTIIKLWLLIYKIIYRTFVIFSKLFVIIFINPLIYLYKTGKVIFGFILTGIILIGNIFKKISLILIRYLVIKIRRK